MKWKQKQINNSLKRVDHLDSIHNFERKLEYKKEKIYLNIVERMNKIDNIK